MAPLSRQAWEKGSVPVQVGVAPAGSSLAHINPNPKLRLKPARESHRLHIPGVHTLHSSIPAPGVPCRQSPKQTDPSVHSPVDAAQLNLLPPWISPFFQTPFFPRNCCFPVEGPHHSSSSKSQINSNFPHSAQKQQPKGAVLSKCPLCVLSVKEQRLSKTPHLKDSVDPKLKRQMPFPVTGKYLH